MNRIVLCLFVPFFALFVASGCSKEEAKTTQVADKATDQATDFLDVVEAQPAETRKDYIQSHASQVGYVLSSKDPEVKRRWEALQK